MSRPTTTLLSCLLFALLRFGAASPLGACGSSEACEGGDDCGEPPAAGRCESSADCAGAEGKVCDLGGGGTCVQCTKEENAACGGTTPLCKAGGCEACSNDLECDSKLCLSSGACVPKAEISYVNGSAEATAASTGCTAESPCGKLGEALPLRRRYLKLSGSFRENIVIDHDVVLHAYPDTKIFAEKDGAIIEITGGSNVELHRLAISGATNKPGVPLSGVGVLIKAGTAAKLTATELNVHDNAGTGIAVFSGAVSLTRSTLTKNRGGGLRIENASFDITSNFIVRNGETSSGEFGGVRLGSATPRSYRFEFNTIVSNQAGPEAGQRRTYSGGLQCNVAGFSARDNILAKNGVDGAIDVVNANRAGTCTHATSIISSSIEALRFASPDRQPFDYHLTASSSALDQASAPSAVVEAAKDVDWDGDQRPAQGRDVGADELK